MGFIVKIPTTTTTLSSPFATMGFARSGVNSSFPPDGSSVIYSNSDTFTISFTGSTNFTPVRYKIIISASTTGIGVENVDDTTGGDLLSTFLSGDTVQSTTININTIKSISGTFYSNQGIMYPLYIQLWVDQANNLTYTLNDTLTYYVNP